VADYFLHALVTLFVTIDPAGLAPIFVILTSGLNPADRRQAAIRATVTAGIVLVCFALFGEPLISVLGISLPAFRIAGGLLLFVIAFEMVFARREERKAATAQDVTDRVDLQHLAIFPLAIPLISGPGAISATILLASSAPGYAALVGLIVIIAGLVGSCLAVFLLAERLERFLGDTGRIVVSRLLGVVLAALSVQFVADGVIAIADTARPG